MKARNMIIVVFTVLTLTGVLFLSLGIVFSYERYYLFKNADTVNATVVSIGTDEMAIVEYEYGGKVYKAKANASLGDPHDVITVYIYPDAPDQPKADKIAVSIAFTVLGFSFVAGFGIPVINIIRKRKRRAKLISEGYRVYADIVSVNQMQNVNMSYGHPFVVVAKYTHFATGKRYVYKSELLDNLPQRVKAGGKVAVYIDYDNPKEYLMEEFE